MTSRDPRSWGSPRLNKAVLVLVLVLGIGVIAVGATRSTSPVLYVAGSLGVLALWIVVYRQQSRRQDGR